MTNTRNKRRWRVVGASTLTVGLLAAVLPLSASMATADGNRVVVEEGESIQAAIDAAEPGTTIVVRGDHQENVWVNKPGIRLIGRDATLTPEEDPAPSPCFPFPDAPAPLICVTTPAEHPPAPADYLDGVVVKGFELEGSTGDGVAAVFTRDLEIARNTVSGSACVGIFVIFNTGFRIQHNTLEGNGCNGMDVAASSNGVVRRNHVVDNTLNGIGFADVSHATIRRNVAEANCMGVVVTDSNDGGYGIRPEPFPGESVRIVKNVVNENTKTCPYGPETIGQTGIGAGGITDLLIRGNTANDNGGDAETLTFGGVFVADFPNLDGTVTVGSDARVIGNTATGNSTAAGPADLVLVAEDPPSVKRNVCDVSIPDPSWCG